ncbi:PEP-CTERM sorting domain-containing protein [Caldimonas brevitalea]|uniref:Ice-binding protein C-terminal domain-containing protein n=1 Tax=Caldimonas brevitalea TaxID=413882 RepID=A0A0G3BDU3_9BURK|nr:PEP-CTERM sorting domain-containing protein [Caldimonas brevitalea]AKJ27462.1 hypothetical protein AAW51_0771 [Caldimonas brevitalea]
MQSSQHVRTFKRLLLAVAAAAAIPSVASAQAWTVDGGNATLTFSQEALDTLNLITVSVSGSGETTSPGAGQFVFPIIDGTFSGDSLATIITQPTAGVNLTRGETVISLNDFRVDAASKTLFGDITIGDTVTQDTALYTFTTVTEERVSLGGQQEERRLSSSGMFITETALNTLSDALGVPAFLRPVVGEVDFGTLNGVVNVTAAVPEPSTYALLGLGLAGVGFLSKRRRAKAASEEAAAQAA